MTTRLDEIVRSGDAREILRVALAAREQAALGNYCSCAEPALHGRDLMCGTCLLENLDQVKRLEELIRGPHAFEPRMPRAGVYSPLAERFASQWCAVCATREDDPRHLAGASA